MSNAYKNPSAFVNLLCDHFGKKLVPACNVWNNLQIDKTLFASQIMAALEKSSALQLIELGNKIKLPKPSILILKKLGNNPLPLDVINGIKNGFLKIVGL